MPKSPRFIIRHAGQPRAAVIIAAIVVGALSTSGRTIAASNVMVWDTGTRLESLDGVNRTAWTVVPTELFSLELEPAKAASDPGYYGREYVFRGDAVVENQRLMAVFSSAKGRVVILAKQGKNGIIPPDGDAARGPQPDIRVVDISPAQTSAGPAKISNIRVLRNAADEVALDIIFSNGAPVSQAVFAFDRTEIVAIKPTGGGGSPFVLQGSIEYGIVPDFIGDDLVYSAADYSSQPSLNIPAENMFLGLLRGGDAEFVMTWPKGNQRIRLQSSEQSPGQRSIDSVEFHSGGQSFYLATLVSPGIWHREKLVPAYLEKDVSIKWQRPFPAKWKTQLYESSVKTTFAIRETKGPIWRGVPGSYTYPVWFADQDVFFRLSKKVPPKGESLIYFTEGRNTPLGMNTPVDILKATLGRQASGDILDPAGRMLRTHHRRGGDGVHRACTCGCTEVIQAIFEAGKEVSQKEHIAEALDDMQYFVRQHVERINQYRKFADEVTGHLQAKRNASPELAPYLSSLEEIARQITEEYKVQQENMKSLDHAEKLSRMTLALTIRHEASNLKAYMELLEAWRAMGGAQDYVLAQCHTITRKLHQEAGYRCVGDPRAVTVAEDIRARCRQAMRNPDGYEIWADY